MSNLLKRAIFGAIYVGLILAALLLREHLVYMTVFGLLVFLGILGLFSKVVLSGKKAS